MNERSSEIGIGIIGLGFMGRTHLKAYAKAAADGISNRLVAVCDADPQRRAGLSSGPGNLDRDQVEERLFDPGAVRGVERPEELFESADIDLVSICTPTASHVPLARAALDAGKHVLLEKPVALTAVEARTLLDASREAATICMPAMCMRFWPAWAWLKERIDDRRFGPVRSAVFRRLGTRPAWAPFYADPEQSGGALLDLHIHDVDFVRFCFGAPDRVTATGGLDHITALYRYDDGPTHVAAEGGWDHSDGFPFRMRYTVVFEEATADFDLGREDQLLLARDGQLEPVEVSALDGYDGEMRHLLAAIQEGTAPTATLEDAVALLELLELERAALA